MLPGELYRNNPAICVKGHLLRDNLTVGSRATIFEVDKAPFVRPWMIDDTPMAGSDDAGFDIRDGDDVPFRLYPRAFGISARRHHVSVVIPFTTIQGVEVIQLSLARKKNRTLGVALLPRWYLKRLAF